jgi:hypothetical protein
MGSEKAEILRKEVLHQQRIHNFSLIHRETQSHLQINLKRKKESEQKENNTTAKESYRIKKHL